MPEEEQLIPQKEVKEEPEEEVLEVPLGSEIEEPEREPINPVDKTKTLAQTEQHGFR